MFLSLEDRSRLQGIELNCAKKTLAAWAALKKLDEGKGPSDTDHKNDFVDHATTSRGTGTAAVAGASVLRSVTSILGHSIGGAIRRFISFGNHGLV